MKGMNHGIYQCELNKTCKIDFWGQLGTGDMGFWGEAGYFGGFGLFVLFLYSFLFHSLTCLSLKIIGYDR